MLTSITFIILLYKVLQCYMTLQEGLEYNVRKPKTMKTQIIEIDIDNLETWTVKKTGLHLMGGSTT